MTTKKKQSIFDLCPKMESLVEAWVETQDLELGPDLDASELETLQQARMFAVYQELKKNILKKIDAYVYNIREWEMYIDALKLQIQRHQAKKKTYTNRISFFKGLIKEIMDEDGLGEVLGEHSKIKITPSGGSAPLRIENPSFLPKEYFKNPELDKRKIAKYLTENEKGIYKAGDPKLPFIPFAAGVVFGPRGKHLRIS